MWLHIAKIAKVQRIQTTAARRPIVLNTQRLCPSKQLLRRFHWRPVYFRISYKIATLIYKILTFNQPLYLTYSFLTLLAVLFVRRSRHLVMHHIQCKMGFLLKFATVLRLPLSRGISRHTTFHVYSGRPVELASTSSPWRLPAPQIRLRLSDHARVTRFYCIVCSRSITLKVTQGHRNYRYSIGHISLSICGL